MTFLMIGAPKCATTSISTILRNHPQIGFTDSMLIDFFSRSSNQNYDEYHRHFHFDHDKVAFGECSTSYSCYPELNQNIHQDIHAYSANMKLIYIVRDPIERTFSDYIHDLERGRTTQNIIETLKNNPRPLYSSRYYSQIMQYLRYFPKEQLLILSYEKFCSEKEAFFNRIADFLQLDKAQFEDVHHVFENKSWTGEKHHTKFDRLHRNMQWTKKILPKPLIKMVWDTITGKNRRKKTTKPKMTMEEKNYLLSQLSEDYEKFKVLVRTDLNEQAFI